MVNQFAVLVDLQTASPGVGGATVRHAQPQEARAVDGHIQVVACDTHIALTKLPHHAGHSHPLTNGVGAGSTHRRAEQFRELGA